MEATFENVMAFAAENEKAAFELYEMMKDAAKKQSAKVMFGELAAEELKHKRFFEGVTEKKMPDDYINRDANFVTGEFYEYVRPLLGGDLLNYVHLE